MGCASWTSGDTRRALDPISRAYGTARTLRQLYLECPNRWDLHTYTTAAAHAALLSAIDRKARGINERDYSNA
jgi:hypothetical protein